MQLESAKALKQELLSRVVVPFGIVAAPAGVVVRARGIPEAARILAASTPLSVGARSSESVPTVQRSVALGIARSGKQFRLAVRVQRQGLMASPLVEHLVKEAKGEADVRMVGRIDKRQGGGAAPWYRGNVRPLLIGASVGHFAVTAGTLGAFVTRNGRNYILSNNHVLANEDEAVHGDAVLQRGSIDGGRDPGDRVGRVRYWVPMKTKGANFVDAALAEVTKKVEFEPLLLRGLVGGADRQLAGLGPEFLDEGDTVYKVGRTTGATEGRVTAFDLDNVVVGFDRGNLRFDGQVEIEGAGNHPFSDGGDSGSLIVDANMRAVALLFAGGDIGGTNGLGLTYANPIHAVLGALKAQLAS